jgi:hypothetical protein
MIEYFVKFVTYKFLLLTLFSPIFILFLLLPEPQKPGIFNIAHKVIGGLLFLCMIAIAWLAHRATERHLNEEEGFHEALKGSFRDARVQLAFLPIVGSVFRYRSKPEQSFEDSRPIE